MVSRGIPNKLTRRKTTTPIKIEIEMRKQVDSRKIQAGYISQPVCLCILVSHDFPTDEIMETNQTIITIV